MRACFLNFYALILIVAVAASPSFAEEAMSTAPDQAAMEQAMKLSMPGDAHKVLDTLAGSWTYTMTHKMAADAPEQTSEGTSQNEWILGGRFIRQNVASTFDMGGQTVNYEGIGTIGFDNVKGHYISSWIDNMGTGMMTATAEYDPETKTLKEKGTYTCPMKGHEISFTSEMKVIDEDHFTYTMYEAGEDGETFKMMDITYTRQKEE